MCLTSFLDESSFYKRKAGGRRGGFHPSDVKPWECACLCKVCHSSGRPNYARHFLIRKWRVIYKPLCSVVFEQQEVTFQSGIRETYSPASLSHSSHSDKEQKSFVWVLIQTTGVVYVFFSLFFHLFSIFLLGKDTLSSSQLALTSVSVPV